MKSAEFDVSNLLEDDDAHLKEEFQACQHFLVDSELDKGRHRVFNLAMSTFYNSLINKKLDLVFKGLKCAAEVNLAFGFVLRNVEDGSCRYFLARENYGFGEVETCVYARRHYKPESENTESWILSIFVQEREKQSQYQMEVLQTDKCDSFCRATQKCTHGL